MESLILFLWLGVELVSGSSVCPKHGLMVCSICRSELIEIEYKGDKSEVLALMKRYGFRCFMGCIRVDLHDKVVDGVNCRGQVFVKPIFYERMEPKAT